MMRKNKLLFYVIEFWEVCDTTVDHWNTSIAAVLSPFEWPSVWPRPLNSCLQHPQDYYPQELAIPGPGGSLQDLVPESILIGIVACILYLVQKEDL